MILTQEQIGFIKMGLQLYADKSIECGFLNPRLSKSFADYAVKSRDLAEMFEKAATVEITEQSEFVGAD